MDKTNFCRLVFVLRFILGDASPVQKRELIETPTSSEGVTCFSEYMETTIHSARAQELRVWMSETLQSKVSLASLDHLNLQLSACGFSLHKDSNNDFLFRASYSGCSVQHQRGYHVLVLNLKRINGFRSRSPRLIMKCPVVSVLPCREQIQCDPEFIQVTREVPNVNWGNELQWFLSLGDFIVALEDASLIQMSTAVRGTNVSVQGRRTEVLSPVDVLGNVGEFLALKLVSGQYAYSMEAICPTVTTSIKEDIVLHILKRHVGLTKRGSHDPEALTVSSVSVNQTDRFTVQETSQFVTLTIPSAQILQTKVSRTGSCFHCIFPNKGPSLSRGFVLQACPDSKRLLQPFYRVGVLLSFKETNHKMQWSIENTLPCTDGPLLKRREETRVQLENSTPDLHMDATSAQRAANASVVFGGDGAASNNATERTKLDFLNVTMNAEPALLGPPTAAERSESLAEPQYRQFTTSSGDKDHQQQLKFIW
ncbi:uncharacterized protein C1orf127 homolog isoform X3 [Takifugu flavidus]|uniref:uncharacterized protein C1orf127 homolog isoform X3 n=1 Tax=Takifugu flavidus TaxID=433684 RepID=UPI0025441CB3|nr:uncharacterized protein C1orf127 homolog isoform X3 [Takifugu flavidus]